MAGVILDKIMKSFGDFTAVQETSLEISEGELLALLGPSGCGKTTILRMIAGFVNPTSGSVLIGNKNVTNLPVHKRKAGMVFQGYALFPHLTVSQNISFGLKILKWDKKKLEARLIEMLQWVRLEKYADHYPKTLSGGQQQRVALARAMANRPEVLLLDEPFSALDAKLRTEMRSEIRGFQKEAGITSIFVTHDQEEAMAIADRIGVMNQGQIEQIGSAQDLYLRPASKFVANFIGKCNLIAGKKTQINTFITLANQSLQFNEKLSSINATAIFFRPEQSWLTLKLAENVNSILVTVKSYVYLGPIIEYEVVDQAGNTLLTNNLSPNNLILVQIGMSLYLNWQAENCIAIK